MIVRHVVLLLLIPLSVVIMTATPEKYLKYSKVLGTTNCDQIPLITLGFVLWEALVQLTN